MFSGYRPYGMICDTTLSRLSYAIAPFFYFIGQDGWTPLYLAVHLENIDMVTKLLGVGADVNIVNDFGVSPLLGACWSGCSCGTYRL